MTGAEVRAARKRLGWSQARLAEALSDDDRTVADMTVWRWEQPPENPESREPPPYLRLALAYLEEHADDP